MVYHNECSTPVMSVSTMPNKMMNKKVFVFNNNLVQCVNFEQYIIQYTMYTRRFGSIIGPDLSLLGILNNMINISARPQLGE